MPAGAYRERVTIQEYTAEDDPLGQVKEWRDVEERWCRSASIDVAGQARYQQIGHSRVNKELVFPGEITLPMPDHRFRHSSTGRYYKAVEPPRTLGGIKQITRLAVKEVDPDDVPD